MKNLKLLSCCVKRYPNIQHVQLISQLYDTIHELLVVHNLKVSKLDTRSGLVELLFDICEIIPVSLEDVTLVELAYFTVERLLICALDNGHVIKYDLEMSQIIDDSNVFPQGIKAMKVSSDNELLIFITSDYNVHLTDCRLEPLNVSSLKDENFGEGEFINVGWGKKETQFHGSEGKEAAKRAVVEQQVLENANDKSGKVTITWRGDSSLFAIGYLHNNLYMFKVYDREGILHYTSEKQPGLECHFSWRPSGNLIATTQQFPNKFVVAFFEKNGLKHGEFLLPFKKTEADVKEICWSSDSEVLCVWFVNTVTKQSMIHLYIVSNYHWYLKHSIVLGNETEVASLLWDESNTAGCGKLLHIFLTNGEYLRYNWVWSVSASKGKTVNDQALVGVIDGKNLLLTSFRKAVIPPPMAGWTIECDSNINHVIFGPQCHTTLQQTYENYFSLVKDNNTIDFYRLNQDYKIDFLQSHSLEDYISGDKQDLTNKLTQLLWISNNVIIGIIGICENISKLLVVDLSMENVSVNSVKMIPVEDELIGLCAYESDTKVLLQTSSGKLMVYSLSDDNFTTLPLHFPESCYEMDVSYKDNVRYVYGLTTRCRFYVDDQEVANNINSFYIHSDFLLLTTLQHQLLCCPFTNVLTQGMTDTKKHDSVSSRKLERGSKIVIAVPWDSRVILQLPRGNIETIQPRSLSLKMIGDLLDMSQYYPAFDLMRKQRINLNLLYDHDPQKFIENIETFIEQINNTLWLSLFIADLDDHDVTTTMYSASYTRKDRQNSFVGEKIKMICQLVRKGLENLNENNKYLLPIISTFVKTNDVQDLEKVLLIIKQLNQQQNNSLISADEAIRYLLYMIDVNKLYDIALGLYDFDLVMFVASKSQKDPKEYIPFLDELKAMDEKYRYFTIDDFLKRYESALKHLVACGEERESELLPYIKKHNLYKTAFKYVGRDDPRYKSIAEGFGNYLVSHKNYQEAGVIFMRCGNQERAMRAFMEALDWRSTMMIVQTLNLEPPAVGDIQTNLLMNLKARKQYDDAVDLLMYQDDPSPTDLIHCCLEGRMYKKVISACAKLRDESLMESTVLPLALEHYTSLLSLIIQNEEQFVKQKARLLIVGQNKKEREELGEDVPEDCDLYSDTSSVMTSSASRSSGRTFRSSKNRRKHERKLVSLKEGSKFEDVALIRSLHGLISSTFALRRDVSEMNFLLQWLNKDQEMQNLQNSLEKVLVQMNNSTSEIWTLDLWVDSNKSNTDSMAAIQGFHDLPDPTSSLEPHLKIPPVVQNVDWKLHSLS